MAILGREAILQAKDLKQVKVEMKEWGGEVILQELTLEQRLALENAPDESGLFRCTIVAMCAVDEAGELLFSVEDVKALAKKNGKAVIKLSGAAIRLNRITKQYLEAEKENF